MAWRRADALEGHPRAQPGHRRQTDEEHPPATTHRTAPAGVVGQEEIPRHRPTARPAPPRPGPVDAADGLRCRHVDRVGVDGDVLGGRGGGEEQQQPPHQPRRAGGVLGHDREGGGAEHEEAGGDPVLAAAVAIHQRRPQQLPGPRQGEQAHEPDLAQRHPVHPEEDRPHVVGDAEGQALGEVEDGDPEENLAFRHRGHLTDAAP